MTVARYLVRWMFIWGVVFTVLLGVLMWVTMEPDERYVRDRERCHEQGGPC